jgi:hypothetical protein
MGQIIIRVAVGFTGVGCVVITIRIRRLIDATGFACVNRFTICIETHWRVALIRGVIVTRIAAI